MSQKSEIDALKEVDEALQAIDEEARKRVLSWANSKYLGTAIEVGGVVEPDATEKHHSPAPKKKKATSTKKKATKTTKKSKTTYKLLKDINLRPSGKTYAQDFVSEKNPPNIKQKCVVALYWVLNVLELEKAGIDHIYTVFKGVQWPLPGNLPNMLHQAGSAGWLDTSDADDIKITPMGENVVEHDLPKKPKQG